MGAHRALALALGLSLTASAIAIPPWRPVLPPAPAPPGEIAGRHRASIAGESFLLELAADAAAREQGLMDRSQIDEHGGMVFVYPDLDERSFWMKNCLVDIDLMYLDDEGRIVALHEMRAEPLQRRGEPEWRYDARLARYSSRVPVRLAIELRAGTMRRLQLRRGDRVTIDLRTLRETAR